MNTTVRTYETRNNTYHIIRIAKTTYEQQQEVRAERLYMIRQKFIGSILMIVSVAPTIIFHNLPLLLVAFFPLLIGFAVTFTKEHVTG